MLSVKYPVVMYALCICVVKISLYDNMEEVVSEFMFLPVLIFIHFFILLIFIQFFILLITYKESLQSFGKTFHIQLNLSSSNTDSSFTMANLNSFLSPYEILPMAQENK